MTFSTKEPPSQQFMREFIALNLFMRGSSIESAIGLANSLELGALLDTYRISVNKLHDMPSTLTPGMLIRWSSFYDQKQLWEAQETFRG